MKNIFTWKNLLEKEKQLQYFQNIFKYIKKQKKLGYTIYPKKEDIFNSLRYTEFSLIKVIIIGQDPYHNPGQANGLSFSVQPKSMLPPSLVNIYKELTSDIPNFKIPMHGYLESWARQGVLLLNSVLTVEKGKANSHANIGWEIFTNKIIKLINKYHQKKIFILWGTYAKKKPN